MVSERFGLCQAEMVLSIKWFPCTHQSYLVILLAQRLKVRVSQLGFRLASVLHCLGKV